MKPMTMRERMLAVIQGHEHDRVPFAIYEILVPPLEVLQHLGHGRIGIIRCRPIYRIEHPHCHYERQIFMEGDTKLKRTILHTPKG